MKTTDSHTTNHRVLLLMLPYWTPLIPPQGISHLKNFLQIHGYIVKTGDANTGEEFQELYNRYFYVLQKYVPKHKQGNFYNIGHDVMRNHMTAHINYESEKEYIQLVKVLIYKTYYTDFTDEQVIELNRILDLFYDRLTGYILGLLEKEKPSVLGISTLRDTIGPTLFAFRLAKKKYPDIMTVMGGSVFSDHFLIGTPNFEYFLKKTPYIDKVIVGEGQILFLKLLQGELPASQKVFTVKDINGEMLGFSTDNVPDMSDFENLWDYPYLAAQGSTGCPNGCSFCNVVPFYGRYREKDPRQTVEEMIELYRKYGMQLFFMNDSLLNHAASGIAEEFLKRDISLYWDGYLRVDKTVCDTASTMLWRRGGMYRARLGVESGSRHVLDLIHKGITPEQTKTALSSLANAGIKTTTYWVIGHPGETEEDFRQSLELLAEIKNNTYEAECNPFIYGFAGQTDSGIWQNLRKPLYPESAREMLIIQSWSLDCEPSREETYRRINRFVNECDKLGIPNPYSMREIYLADERWKKLHKNAVPSVIDFKEKNMYIDECRHIKQLSFLQDSMAYEGDFDFN